MLSMKAVVDQTAQAVQGDFSTGDLAQGDPVRRDHDNDRQNSTKRQAGLIGQHRHGPL